MTKFYYGWINYSINLTILNNLKRKNIPYSFKTFNGFNNNDWYSDHHRGFFSRGFILKDSSITYNVVENWLEYQDGKTTSILSELTLTQGTYYND